MHAKGKNTIACFLLVYLLSFFIHCTGNAQEMPPFKKGTDTAEINKSILTGIFLNDADSAILILKRAAQLSIEGDYLIGAARALREIGTKYIQISNYEEGMNYLNQSLSYAEKSKSKNQVAITYSSMGVLYGKQGNYMKGAEKFFKALGALKNIDSSNCETAINIDINLSNIYDGLAQYDKVLYYLDQAEILVKNGNITSNNARVHLATIFIDRGHFYTKNNKPDSAIKYFEQALDIAKRLDVKMENQRIYFQVLADANLGGLFLQTGEYEKAVSYCQKVIPLAKNKFVNIASLASYNLGGALLHLKKYKAAEAVLASALREKAVGDKNQAVVGGYFNLTEVYRATNQYKKALDCMDSMVALKDTLMTTEKVKAINQMELKYDIAEKDKQIIKNELLIEQQKNKITRKNIWIGSISSGIFIISIISIGVYRNNRRKQEEEIRALKQQNTISILKGVVQGEENERIRLARDLHDGIGGMLSATKMRFMTLRHDNEDLMRSPKYLEAMGLLDIMGDEIRKTSHNLMPEVLLKQNLAEALRTYCNTVQAGTDLHIDFQSFGNFECLPNDFKLNIYRIVQELLKNTLQHAKATYVVVQMMLLEAYLTISVEDNGIGFDAAKTKDGIGLQNLKTRVLSHEGHYTLKSDPGKGTTIYIEFGMPLAGNA